MSSKNTYINWITTLYNDDNEWLGYEKSFAVEKEIKTARSIILHFIKIFGSLVLAQDVSCSYFGLL